MAQFTTLEESNGGPTVAKRDVSLTRLERAIVRFERSTDLETFASDYNRSTLAELMLKHPDIFSGDEREEQRGRNLLYALLTHLKIPRKNATAAPVAQDAQPSPPRVTPQTLRETFPEGVSVQPDDALAVLAQALLPYLRDALLDDLTIALGVVKQARGAS